MNKPKIRPPRLAASVGLVLLCATAANAQFTNKVTTTPVIIQDGFGPAGDQLPYGGQEYCCPTAVSMSLSYLGVNGFNQIAPTSPTTADELNLDEIMSGLMATNAITGTAYVSNMTSALSTYLAAEGIGTSSYSLSTYSAPTISQLTSLNQPGTVVDLVAGYYDPSGSGFVRNGGHCVALLNEGETAGGQPAPNTLVINNPLPGAFEPSADLPSNSLQSLNTIPTTGSLTSDGSIELDPSQFPGFFGTTQTVIETAIVLTVNPDQESADDPAITTWNWTGTQTLSPAGGDFTVLAPVQGAGGIDIATPGTVEFENTDTATGSNTVADGTWRSDVTSGSSFGAGSIDLTAGTLELVPTAGTSAVSLQAAGASGSQLQYADGSILVLNRNGNTSLSLEIGGNADQVTPNIVREGTGTLVIEPSDGTATLGILEQLTVRGTSFNLPAITNGIVNPSIVAADDDGNLSGDFLTYGANGFTKAAYTEAGSTPITSATSTTVFDAEIPQTIPASTTASVYALKVGPVSIGGGASSTLDVGPGAAGQAGVILNGGALSASSLNFGPAEGLVYSSLAGGIINSTIQGSGGLTTFGPGSLTLTGANSFSGGTHINSGTLIAANTGGSITGTGAITVEPNATFEIDGPSGAAGGSGGTTVAQDATLLMNGGTLAGPATLSTGSFLFGAGTFTGTADVYGTIGGSAVDFGASPFAGVEDLDFTGKVNMDDTTIYDWRLDDLTTSPADAGIDWSQLKFTTSAAADVGTSSSPINITLDLGPGVPDPNSGNAFWSTSHLWDVATDPDGFNEIWEDYDFPTYSQGYFSVAFDTDYHNMYIDYTAVPEPIDAGLILTIAIAGLSIRGRCRGELQSVKNPPVFRKNPPIFRGPPTSVGR
jgi:autotransporter-associated beta strand protein